MYYMYVTKPTFEKTLLKDFKMQYLAVIHYAPMEGRDGLPSDPPPIRYTPDPAVSSVTYGLIIQFSFISTFKSIRQVKMLV